MSRRGSRWSLLVVFAACNLVFWIAVATGIGVVASDMVDLGVESYLREKQATVAAIGAQAPSHLPDRTPGPTQEVDSGTASTRAVDDEEATETVVTRVEPTEVRATSPASTQPRATAVRMTPYATRTEPAPTVAAQAPSPQPTRSVSGNPPPASQDSAALASAPLLLADPDLSELVSLDAEIRQSAVGRPVQIRYREAALNKEIADLLASEPDLPYQNIQADLQSDSVTLTGDVIVMEVEFPTVIKGKVLARDCLPQVEIESVSVSGILTPGFIKDRIKAVVDDAFSWYPADYALCLEQIVLEEDRATIYGSTR
jgi:hypothetical protein